MKIIPFCVFQNRRKLSGTPVFTPIIADMFYIFKSFIFFSFKFPLRDGIFLSAFQNWRSILFYHTFLIIALGNLLMSYRCIDIMGAKRRPWTRRVICGRWDLNFFRISQFLEELSEDDRVKYKSLSEKYRSLSEYCGGFRFKDGYSVYDRWKAGIKTKKKPGDNNGDRLDDLTSKHSERLNREGVRGFDNDVGRDMDM